GSLSPTLLVRSRFSFYPESSKVRESQKHFRMYTLGLSLAKLAATGSRRCSLCARLCNTGSTLGGGEFVVLFLTDRRYFPDLCRWRRRVFLERALWVVTK